MLTGRVPHEDGRRKVEYSLLPKESLQNASPFLKERVDHPPRGWGIVDSSVFA